MSGVENSSPAARNAKLATTESRPASAGKCADDCYLPDFSSAAAVIALILISELVAMALTIARGHGVEQFFLELARCSLLILWMTLTSAGVLTLARPVLARRGTVAATTYALGLVLACIAMISELIYSLGQYFATSRLVNMANVIPATRWEFLLSNLLLGLIVAAGVLRYFYVTHQWRSNVEREAESRIIALQARIRPHFLFNSMNTIAALTRSDPVAAERAVEDLSDLFRASLSNPGESITLEQELEVARVYQRMEAQRLGGRLTVDWQIEGLPMQTRVPGLTIQPLLENAIYHGIEPSATGGVISVVGATEDDMVTITVSNPVAPDGTQRLDGHQLALDNIRQRLDLAYGRRGRMEVERAANTFRVLIGFPLAQSGKGVA